MVLIDVEEEILFHVEGHAFAGEEFESKVIQIPMTKVNLFLIIFDFAAITLRQNHFCILNAKVESHLCQMKRNLNFFEIKFSCLLFILFIFFALPQKTQIIERSHVYISKNYFTVKPGQTVSNSTSPLLSRPPGAYYNNRLLTPHFWRWLHFLFICSLRYAPSSLSNLHVNIIY